MNVTYGTTLSRTDRKGQVSKITGDESTASFNMSKMSRSQYQQMISLAQIGAVKQAHLGKNISDVQFQETELFSQLNKVKRNRNLLRSLDHANRITLHGDVESLLEDDGLDSKLRSSYNRSELNKFSESQIFKNRDLSKVPSRVFCRSTIQQGFFLRGDASQSSFGYSTLNKNNSPRES